MRASNPSIFLAVKIRYAACFWPTTEASATAATGGKQPKEISGNFQVADSEVITRSHIMATSAPPPWQFPLTAATNTFREETIARKIAWNFVSISSIRPGGGAATDTPAA